MLITLHGTPLPTKANLFTHAAALLFRRDIRIPVITVVFQIVALETFTDAAQSFPIPPRAIPFITAALFAHTAWRTSSNLRRIIGSKLMSTSYIDTNPPKSKPKNAGDWQQRAKSLHKEHKFNNVCLASVCAVMAGLSALCKISAPASHSWFLYCMLATTIFGALPMQRSGMRRWEKVATGAWQITNRPATPKQTTKHQQARLQG